MPNGSAILIDDNGKLYTEKDEHELLDYPFNFAEELAAIDDSISSFEFDIVGPTSGEVAPLELDDIAHPTTIINSLTDAGVERTNACVVVWVKGGTNKKSHNLTCRITTVDGRVYDKTLKFKIKPS